MVFIVPAVRGGVEVIEAGFTDRDDFWMLRKLAECREKVFGGFVDVAGVNANTGEDLVEALRNGEIGGDVRQIGGDGDEAMDICFTRSRDELVEFLGGKFVGSEVAVGVGEHFWNAECGMRNAECGSENGRGLLLEDGFAFVEAGVGDEEDGGAEHEPGEEPEVSGAFEFGLATSEVFRAEKARVSIGFLGFGDA